MNGGTRRAGAVIAVISLALPACFAYRHPAARDAHEGELATATFPKLVVGFVEPEVEFVEAARRPRDEPVDRGRLTTSFELIALMRSTGYFEEVDFSRRLKSAPDVLITAEPRVDPDNGRWSILSVATAGIVPIVVFHQQDLGFSVVGASGAAAVTMAFSYREDVGWGFPSLLLLLLPEWRAFPSPPPRAVDDLRRLLMQRRAVFEQLAGASAPR